jgi:nicotinamidase-related amidase
MPPLDRQRGFGRRVGFGVAPAVVVIDMIGGFTDPGSPLGSAMPSELAAARRVLDVARRAELPIYFSTVYYEDDGVWSRKIATMDSLRLGTDAVEVDPSLGRRPDEPLIAKKYASVFFGTDLMSRLAARRVDTVVLVGCTTSGCVRATAVDAISWGLRPIVVREAVADRSPAAHEQSLIDLDDKYADVMAVADVLAELTSDES